MYAWYQDQVEIDPNVNISQKVWILKAHEIDEEMYPNDNDAKHFGRGWLVGFKERFGIKSKTSNNKKEISNPSPLPSTRIFIKQEIREEPPKVIDHKLKAKRRRVLQAASELLDYISETNEFHIKDVITVRMIKDKIANDIS